MKILKIIHGYPPHYNAGSEVYTQSVCNELMKKHEVVLFSREENEYELDFKLRKTYTDTNIPHYLINLPREKDGYNHSVVNQYFKDVVIAEKPDIAHIGHLNHLSTGIVDVLNELNVPILFTLHDFWLMCPRGQFLQRNFDGENLYSLCSTQSDGVCAENCYSMYFSGIEHEFDSALYYMNRMEPPYTSLYDSQHWSSWIGQRMKTTKELIKKIDLFHAPSRYLMNRFINDFNIPENKIFYLDYGFPLSYLRPVGKKEKSVFTFGYIGTHIPAKGVNLLIEAFSKINKNSKLMIFGRENGQSTNALKNMAKNTKNPVEFAGEYINKNLAKTVFNNIDCIVVPSIWAENSPLVIHEAQACHIPVITADFGGMCEYVHHKINGLLFKHRNAASLKKQMEYAVNNPEEMFKLGKRAYLYSKNGEVPSIENHCEELTNYYQNLINNGK
jgi:glycosyltransferase involved in cell wall biosynthesis